MSFPQRPLLCCRAASRRQSLAGNNSLRTTEGAHRAEQWHVDPPVWFPLPPEIEKHDPRIGTCALLSFRSIDFARAQAARKLKQSQNSGNAQRKNDQAGLEKLQRSVSMASARIAAIQELQIRLQSSKSIATPWSQLIKSDSMAKHAIAWLLRCVAGLAEAQCALSKTEDKVVELQVSCDACMLSHCYPLFERRRNY